ncbi:hypothetical protein [Paenibacillus ehimensis]|uniref:Uncharacterized protein n=1 Tax=Paenibacillus ehimensis TaxID=79264 RepID=A0ABT8VBD7_9BACL|nr:hypothetical protein [Paenibacillus ehimensis]MDO3678268.1 hypothetical protein [Paenibacillus ehimensis]MEC0210313.1 hypothetical protein [Paenibacillus ehimensis]
MASRTVLPAPDDLKRRLLTLAALDVILCPEEWLRYHTFIPNWAPNVSLAKIDNGAGDHLYVLFAPEGVLIKGFDHESELSPHAGDEYAVWPGIYDGAPEALLAFLEDEALEKEDVTFCIWRETGDSRWRSGEVRIPEGADDGSDFLLGTICETPEDYADWAEGYFDRPVPAEPVKALYAAPAIRVEAIRSLNPERNVEEALRELDALGITVTDRERLC